MTVTMAENKTETVRRTILAAAPLVIGVIVLIVLGGDLDQGGLDLYNISIFRSAFVLSSFVYAILCASLAVVFVGTIIYVSDMIEMVQLVSRDSVLIYWAFLLLVLGILIIPIALVIELSQIGAPTVSDFCSARDLTKSFSYHDGVVLIIFSCFAVVDILTIYALQQTLAKLDDGNLVSERGEKLLSKTSWAKAQLYLIDVPVVFCTIALLFGVHFIEGRKFMMHFDYPIMMPAATGGVRAASEKMTRLLCNGIPLTELQAFVGNTFIGGVAAGSLAAQVLMSQFIFMMLSIVFRQMPGTPPGHLTGLSELEPVQDLRSAANAERNGSMPPAEETLSR